MRRVSVARLLAIVAALLGTFAVAPAAAQDEAGDTPPDPDPDPEPAPASAPATVTARASAVAPVPASPRPDAVTPPKPSAIKDRTYGPHEGFRVAATPGVAFDFDNSSMGFNLGLEGTLGFELGPIVVAGGIAAQMLVSKGTSILMGFPEVRIIVPIGDFGPFVVAGAGIGADGTTGKADLAIRAGGGVQYVFTDEISVVLGGAYHIVGDRSIASIELGPRVSF